MIDDMATMSKAFQIFDSNIRGMKQHLQLMDASLVNANRICRDAAKNNSVKTIADALKSMENYPQLNTPCKPIDIGRTFKTARTKIHEQAIVELYKYYMTYLLNLIKEFLTIAPTRLLKGAAASQDNKMSYEDILLHYDNNELIEIMSKGILRRLENARDTQGLLQKILKFSGISINEQTKKRALLYLNIRHLIIHNNSKADEKFIRMNDGLIKINSKNKIILNYELSSNAIQTISALCSEIDEKLLGKKLLNPVMTHDKTE